MTTSAPPTVPLSNAPGAIAGDVEEPATDSMKQRVMRSTLWMTTGYLLSHMIRFGSNLILTRLLAPELFGLMALVNAFLSGMQMFSDLGLAPSIIHSPRGTEENFLNTAWTLQALRGTAIAVVACLTSPLLGQFYEEPLLPALIIGASLNPVLSGFNTTGTHTENRGLRLKRIVFVELAGRIAGVTVNITWAVLAPSVWALVGGSIAGALATLIAGHLLLPSHRHRFAWDKSSLTELVRFGRWIFLSTACTFFVLQSDRFIVGKLFSMTQLGVYAIAVMMLQVAQQLFTKFKLSILLPVYSSVRRTDPASFAQMVRRSRIRLLKLTLLPIVFLIAFGDLPVLILFDERYADAGWLLQALTCGWLVEMCFESGPVLLSHGDSRLMATVGLVQASVQIALMVVGGRLFGIAGVAFGILAGRLLCYPLVMYQNRKYQVWFWKIDLGSLALAALAALSLYELRQLVEGML